MNKIHKVAIIVGIVFINSMLAGIGSLFGLAAAVTSGMVLEAGMIAGAAGMLAFVLWFTPPKAIYLEVV